MNREDRRESTFHDDQDRRCFLDSYPVYLRTARRPAWLRVDRLLGGTASRKTRPRSASTFRPAWRNGARKAGNRRHGRRFATVGAWVRREIDEQLAGRLAKECMSAHKWSEAELKTRPKGDAGKAELARLLRRQTPVSRQWVADLLHSGSASYVSHPVNQKP